MEESQNFGHQHPLLLLNEEQINNGSKNADCSRCGEKVSAPSFSCVDCGFYLHKKCAEAPLEINHPLHCDHPLVLLQTTPYDVKYAICDFCDQICERFVYHCSCGLDFHIKCALFTYNIALKNFEELEHVALKDPLISTENYFGEDLEKCFGCCETLANYTYFSLDCGFSVHKKCAELPLKINHLCHRKHPFVLQFNSERLSCKICQETRRRGFVYCCSPCKFVVHIECASPSPIIEDKSHHPHPFTLFWRQSSFICDACGIEGNYVAYICSTCCIIMHKKCISLPRITKSWWHDHRVFHTYFLHKEDFRSLNCIFCHDEVDIERGSYYCASCNIIFHVNCATKYKVCYQIVSPENENEQSIDSLAILSGINSITIIERNDVGEATKIKYVRHIHNLMLCDKIMEYDKCCDGCMLPISASFYYCSQCDFFLHKACAELPQMKHVWFHECQQASILTSGCIFRCQMCHCLSNGFAYKCNKCEKYQCLRCVTAIIPGAQTCQGHEHSLFFYDEPDGQCPCRACGKTFALFRCKDCKFALDYRCISLPNKAQHKCDEHFLALSYHDDNKYSDYHYCDICEEGRDPNRWFYHCATCNTSAHIDCVLGDYPYIKVGSIYKEGNHPHPLIFVKKTHVYPECIECGKLCQDLALECAESGCNYVAHYKCV